MSDLATLHPDGRLRFTFHRYQWQAIRSSKRFVLLLAGRQSGKTVTGPPWLYREIFASRPDGSTEYRPGDYLVATPTYPLLINKALPEFTRLFEQQLRLGKYNGSRHSFDFHDGKTRVIFGHADSPDSLEAMTARAAWLDEAGQKKFRFASWEAIQGRLAVNQGRAIITSTPYDLGWLKQQLYDPWEAAGRNHPLIDVVQFDSRANLAFSPEEYERLKAAMPRWRFDMFYRGRFTRPAGLIYDCFDRTRHVVKRFPILDVWPRYLGLDFGGVNTAGVFIARDPSTGKLYAYREYHPGCNRTAAEHKRHLLEGEPKHNDGKPRLPMCVGGSKSEEQWRAEFRAAGLPVQEPAVHEVEVGIDRVYAMIAAGDILFFDDLAGLLDELESYSREVDEQGAVLEKIANKEDYHHLDALRYACSRLKRGPSGLPRSGGSAVAKMPEGVWA